ncbi:hypothetical protein D3C76_306810 [compost metagenome]
MTARYLTTGENGGQITSPALLKNGITYVSAGLRESAGLQVTWGKAHQQALLMLIERKTGKQTLLYQKLLDAEQQKFAETNDLPFYGDNLKFIKREANALLFTNEYVRDGKIYKYLLPGK